MTREADQAPANIENGLEQAKRERRWEDALQIARQMGKLAEASQLAEQACLFDQAARLALDAGNAYRAVHMAALAGDDNLVDEAIDVLIGSPDKALAAAQSLESRGKSVLAARLYALTGHHQEAASAYDNAGLLLDAAKQLLRAKDDRGAAKALEDELKIRPDNHEAAILLAELLIRHRRYQPATPVLQKIPSSSPWRDRAIPLLIDCYEALGLDGPKQDLQLEAERKGLATRQRTEPYDDGPQADDELFGRYKVIDQVATSSSAALFKATDMLSDSLVALKQVHVETLQGSGLEAFQRMARELRRLAQLRHPNIVPIVDLVPQGATVVMPWLSGGSLDDQLNRQPLAPARAVEIAEVLLDALGQAHRLGIIHRNIKPSNVLFDEAATPMLSDFGSAHVKDTSATATADVLGAFGYMSPEQRWGIQATPASDVYGVGAILLEMLTAQHPSGADDWTPKPPSSFLPQLDSRHDQLILGMLAKDAEHRPNQALQVRRALLSLSWPNDPKQSVKRPTTTHRRVDKQSQRLQMQEDGTWWDTWMQRQVVLLPWNEKTQQLARVYASAEQVALCDVLRVDQTAGTVWFAVPPGTTLSSSGQHLNDYQASRLWGALAWLHERGVAHGSVDENHVYLCQGEPMLALAAETWETASIEADRSAMRELLSRRHSNAG